MNNRTRIFLVDDHPLVRDWLSTLLRQEADFDVCGQADGVHTALAGIRDAAADVAIVDLALKDGSGLDLIRTLKQEMPNLHVIVLSMHEEAGYVERALRAGARGYITKRESTGQVVNAIRQVVGGRIYANAELLGLLAERAIGSGGANVTDPMSVLSDRELEVFRRIGLGESTRTIATGLGVSVPTVQTYSMRIKEKLGLSSIGELIRAAVRWIEEQQRR